MGAGSWKWELVSAVSGLVLLIGGMMAQERERERGGGGVEKGGERGEGG